MNSERICIQGKQIILRDWLVEDLEEYAHWMKPGHQWQELDGPYYPKTKEAEIPDMIAKMRGKIETAVSTSPRRGFVIADKLSNQMLGTVSRYWIGKETNWLAVGIAIHNPEYWQGGRGFESLGLWSDYLFQNMLQIVRLDLRTWSGNIGMMRLAEKLGYKEEARFRMARIVKGEYFDGMGYGVLREEWEMLYPKGFDCEHLTAK